METNKQEKKIVLVVDDQPQNLQLAASVLNPLYRLILADNGEKAIALALKKQPDIILLDIMMPDMSGFEVCEQLKAHPDTKDIPVIFVTAKTEEDDTLKAYEAGGIDYVQKPFRANELIARIAAHVTLKSQREDIIALNKNLSAVNEQKSKLLSLIAHDMRGAISFIDNMLDLLISDIERTPTHELREYMTLVKETSEKTYEMFDELLLWANTQSQHISLSQEFVCAADIARRAAEHIQLQADAKRVQIVVEDSDADVYADVNMLNTIIRNLLSNAIKFSESDKNVTVRIQHSKTIDGVVEISVCDQGIGIKSEDLEKIFDQTQNYTTRGTKGEKGTGLGLDLCRDFVQLHGGTIRAQSEYGKGSTFTFTMPTAPALVEAATVSQ